MSESFTKIARTITRPMHATRVDSYSGETVEFAPDDILLTLFMGTFMIITSLCFFVSGILSIGPSQLAYYLLTNVMIGLISAGVITYVMSRLDKQVH